MDTTEAKLKAIVSWMNVHYNQNSENYSIIHGAKPEVIRYDDNTAISTWSCGAIICIHAMLFFIMEDDGNWFLSSCRDDSDEREYGYQTSFSIGWLSVYLSSMK